MSRIYMFHLIAGFSQSQFSGSPRPELIVVKDAAIERFEPRDKDAWRGRHALARVSNGRIRSLVAFKVPMFQLRWPGCRSRHFEDMCAKNCAISNTIVTLEQLRAACSRKSCGESCQLAVRRRCKWTLTLRPHERHSRLHLILHSPIRCTNTQCGYLLHGSWNVEAAKRVRVHNSMKVQYEPLGRHCSPRW